MQKLDRVVVAGDSPYLIGALSLAVRPRCSSAILRRGQRRVGAPAEFAHPTRLGPQVPKVCELLEAAEEDLLAFMAFPQSH